MLSRNRAIVDVISDYNLPYTQRGKEYLIHSGIHPRTIFVTGSPIAEVGFNKNNIVGAIDMTIKEKEVQKIIVLEDYKDTNVSSKVAKLIIGLTAVKKYHGKAPHGF